MTDHSADDPYKLLGLDPRPDLATAEIKRAYRKRALSVHPDKRPSHERERAQREFDALQKAYDILLDPEARKALENLAKVKAARRDRDDAQDAKRRKMREELARRERAAERGKTEEEEAKEKLQAELARLRRDFATRKKAYDRESSVAGPTQDAGDGANANGATHAVPEHLYRALKVVWRKDAGGGVEYPVAKLRSIFSAFGDVEDVVIRDGKKKKGSALVVFSAREGAKRAASAACGDPSNPLLAVRAAIPPAGEDVDVDAAATAKTTAAAAAEKPRPPPAPPPSFSGGGGVAFNASAGVAGGALFPGGGAKKASFGGGAPAPFGSFDAVAGSHGQTANKDYESVVLDKLRRAQEKARIIAEMRAADDAEEAA